MSATICRSSSSRSVRCATSRKPVSSTSITTPQKSASGTETEMSSRRLSECTRRRPAAGLRRRVPRQRQTITAPAQRLDRVQAVLGVELAAQPPDQHLDDVAVALEVLIVQAFGELALGDDFTGTQ